ncbi:hypothetical protein PRIPAC_95540 [Pristionchus pacificus]|uniref:Ankyrin repeat-containing protein n=1 Tax=Pristionchus pacificus TaxID=54126 RepID=A0A2A6D1F4_PRIPA|nr:hypothetical protein PRIPAC_95540 [Pristionchus pacificus]|eukprot:PDM84245.1 Ankyrin repeat-containing protein [Pristionchus pacificus]
MPSTSSGCARRCCKTALVAVTRRHVDCIRAMATPPSQSTKDDDGTRQAAVRQERRLLAVDVYGESALHLAVRRDDKTMVKLLLSVAPSLLVQQSMSGETAALLAAAMGRQAILLELLSGTDAKRIAMLTDSRGTSVLMAAVARGDTKAAKYLIERFGADLLMLPNRSRVAPAHVAAAHGDADFLKAALKVSSTVVHCADSFGCTPALYDVQGGSLRSLRFLIEQSKDCLLATNNKGMSLLHVACIAGDDNVVRFLLGKMGKAAIEATTKDNANAVHCAAYSGHTHILAQLLGCISKKKRKEMLTARDSRGNSALHLAAMGNHSDAALFLVEAGAEPAQLNLKQQSARDAALARGHGSVAGILAVAKASKAKNRRSIAIPSSSSSSQTAALEGQSSSGIRLAVPLPKKTSSSALSSGYSSAGESLDSPKPECCFELHDFANEKQIDDVTWRSEGLKAVDDLDRFLNEFDDEDEEGRC